MNPERNSQSQEQTDTRRFRWAYLGSKTLCLAIAALSFLLLSASRSEAASYKRIIDGITVSYSGEAVAYYDTNDNTLTVEIGTGGGNLNITVGSTASYYWGSGVDIYILAGNDILKSISIKGNWSCVPYVCGDVYYVNKFSLMNGVVGDTIYYGPSFGLGMNSSYIPAAISLKNSYATAQIFGYPNSSPLSAKTK